ncbi:hypothetical protein FRC98_17110 [Lujinxingia vulgaris]|uniref:Uncharacterized protein n=1 Tax=Lujinxingia vulgaris TaxID=2600176 RepID=A0A5C6X6B2_9DELT|nr:hypothetical protein [Lujinxingia vulgaris]TXD35185.1 hypothetical protein FRC98_17110 [Lujinxingia vulgaris]
MMIKTPHSFAPITAIAALGLLTTGCPSVDNDLDDRPPIEDPDVGTDEPDVSPDAFALCEVSSVSPATYPLDQAEHALQLQLLCDTLPPNRQFGESIAFRGERTRSDAPPLRVEAFDCVPAEALHACSLSLGGLTAPEGVANEHVGPERLTLEDASGQPLEVPIRWALSAQQIADLIPNRDISRLPAAFSERGLDLYVRATEQGRLIAGTMRAAEGGGIEIVSVNDEGEATVHATLDVDDEDLSGSTISRETGPYFELDAWSFDPDEGVFTGTTVLFDAAGDFERSAGVDSGSYEGPQLTELLGITFTPGDAPGGRRQHGTALTRTANATLAIVGLGYGFDPDAVILSNQLDALGTTPAAELAEGQVGLTSIQNTPRVWFVDEDRQFNLLTTSGEALGSASLASFGVQYPFELKLLASTDTRLLVEITRENQRAFASVEVDGEGMVNGKVDHLNLPENCRPDGRQSILASSASSLAILCNDSATGAPLRVEWTGLGGEAAETAVAPTAVTPLVPSRHSGLTAGDLAMRTLLPDGTMRLDRVSDLSTSCTTAGDCSLPITDFTPDGWRMNLAPGTRSSTWSVAACCGGGDILIDGVPLCCEGPPWEGEGGEIDLSLTAPPIIVDAPGASAADDVAMILINVHHERATHAVWTLNAQGQISEPGLLHIDTGDANTAVVFQNAESEDNDDDEAQEQSGFIEIEIVVEFSEGVSGDTVGSTSGTFTITAARLAQAIGADEPLSFSLDDPAFELSDTTVHTVVSAPATRIATEDFSDGDNHEVLATLTAAQAAHPLTFTYSSEGLVMRSAGGNGDEGDAPLDVLLDDEPLSSENPIFVGGQGPGSNILQHSAAAGGVPFRGKIKRIAIKKKRVGTNLHASSRTDGESDAVIFEVVLEELTLPEALADQELRLLETGDFNGDGFEDLVVRSAARTGSIVLFDDGNGGLSQEFLEVPGGPTTVFPPGANAAVEGNGKGTRKASYIKQSIHIELL